MLAAALLICVGQSALSQSVPEPETYRTDHYRDLVPDKITGGTTINAEQAYALWQAKSAGFIDVLPKPPKPSNLPEGTIWREKKRNSIPGALWLPNVGYGEIADVTAQYFLSGLKKATGGDKTHPVVIFCLEECWMSWNASKRAIEWGYSDVYWLPEGTDGWAFYDFPLEQVQPMEGEPQAGS